MPREIQPYNVPRKPEKPQPYEHQSNVPEATPNRAQTYEESFLAGMYVSVQSTWLRAIRYEPFLKQLKVWFDDGYACTVQEVSPELALSCLNAESKGTWYHNEVLGTRGVEYVPGKSSKMKVTPGV